MSIRSSSRLVAVLLAGTLAAAAGLRAAEPPSPTPKGAKALFGEGMSERFLPREAQGGSAAMNATNQVTEAQLTSFYKPPEFPGVAYSLEVLQPGDTNVRTVEDPYRWEFRSGDRIRLRIVPNFAGYAYVLQAKDQDNLVYPASFGSQENFVRAGQECYVPVTGWLRLVDPAEPFTMKVLFRPGTVDYPLNRPEPNPAVARVALQSAVSREWTLQRGSKGMVYESDRSYVDVPATPGAAPSAAPSVAGGGTIDRATYNTTYAVRTSRDEGAGDAIALEIPIRQVGR